VLLENLWEVGKSVEGATVDAVAFQDDDNNNDDNGDDDDGDDEVNTTLRLETFPANRDDANRRAMILSFFVICCIGAVLVMMQ